MSDNMRILRPCARPGCQVATRTKVCGACWARLPERTRSDIVRTHSRITSHPDDDLARDLNGVAWGIALRQWEAR